LPFLDTIAKKYSTAAAAKRKLIQQAECPLPTTGLATGLVAWAKLPTCLSV